jgi:hypothetical protein
MKFDQTIQNIAESLYELETEVNQDFQNWKASNPKLAATGSAYLHFKKGRTDDTYAGGKRGRPSKSGIVGSPVAADVSAPVVEPAARYRELPATLATKNKVEEIFNADPGVGLEEVMTRVKADAENGENLNTDDDVIVSAYNELAQGRSGETSGALGEPAIDSEEQKRLARHAAIRAAMARRGMKTADPEVLASRLGRKKFTSKRKPEGTPGAEEIDIPAGDIEDIEGVTGRKGRPTDSED